LHNQGNDRFGPGLHSPAGYRGPLRRALIDDNTGHMNVVMCGADNNALKRGASAP